MPTADLGASAATKHGNRDRRREVGEVGLLSIIFYNHGVELMGEKRYPEELLAFLWDLSLVG